MSSKNTEFGWLASQAEPKPVKPESLTLDELLKILNKLKKAHGGDIQVVINTDGGYWTRPIKEVVKPVAEKKIVLG